MTSGQKYDSIIAYTKRLGFPAIHAYGQGFLHPDRATDGWLDEVDERRKPFKLASGRKSHKEFANMLPPKV